MPQTLWLRAAPHRPLEWLLRDALGRTLAGPDTLRAGAVLPSADLRVVVWCDPSLMLRRVALPKSGLSKWRQGLTYLAEDWIAGDVSQVHVAAPQRLVGRETFLAVAERERLRELIAELQAFGIDADKIIPEPALLGPARSADVIIDGDFASFCGADNGGCTEPEMLSILVDESARILIGRASGEHRGDHVDSALRWASLQPIDDTHINLRSGEFAAPRTQQRTPYRPALIAVAAALVVHTGAVALEWYRAQRDVAAAEARTEAAFRDAFGSELRMVNAAFQLQQAASIGANRTGGGALPLLQRIAPLLASDSRLVLVGFEYRDGMMEVAVRAPDASRFDGFREQLAASGLKIEIANTQYDANEFTGRLRIRGAG